MRTASTLAPFGLCALLLLASAAARAEGDLFVYPAREQSKDQQDQDTAECHQWAKAETGVDPLSPRSAPAPRPGGEKLPATTGTAARGAAAGAAVGAGKGGAGAGALGRVDALYGEGLADEGARTAYQKAFGACMEGRGYAVR